MRHPIDAVEHAAVDSANVFLNQLDAISQVQKRRVAPIQTVEHAHVVARREQALAEHDADVSASAGDEDLHADFRLWEELECDGSKALTFEPEIVGPAELHRETLIDSE